MKIGSFPLTRRVLLEKIGSRKSLKEGEFRIKFIQDNVEVETLIVDSVSPIQITTTSVEIVHGGILQLVPSRQQCGTLSFRILEYEDAKKGDSFSKWINSFMFNDGSYSPIRVLVA